MKIKHILVGNPHTGYDPLEGSIDKYAIYFQINVLSRDLINWREKAKHGDVLEIPGGINFKKHFICIEL